jgi:sigma-E factor negative regulatory protein RseA
MALALVAWLSLQVGTEPAPQIASVPQENISSVRPVSSQSDDYLRAHQEYSPSADVHGAASYIHAVAGR